MFNRTLVLPTINKTEYVTREVHEHKAPTDESVKLLREMEAKAREQVIASISLDNNKLTGVVKVHFDPCKDAYIATAVVDINGKRLTASVERHTHHGMPTHSVDGVKQLLAELRGALAIEIAREAISFCWDGWNANP